MRNSLASRMNAEIDRPGWIGSLWTRDLKLAAIGGGKMVLDLSGCVCSEKNSHRGCAERNEAPSSMRAFCNVKVNCGKLGLRYGLELAKNGGSHSGCRASDDFTNPVC